MLSYTIKEGDATGGLDGVAAAAVAEAAVMRSNEHDMNGVQESDAVKWQQREIEIKREIAEINLRVLLLHFPV